MADFPAVDTARLQKFPLVTSQTTLFSPGALNTKGPYSTISSGTTFQSNWLLVSRGRYSQSENGLMDIAIGAPGSEQPILTNLLYANGNAGAFVSQDCFLIPITVPQSAMIHGRYQSSAASLQLQLTVQVIAGGFMSPQGFSRAVTYGSSTGNSRGISIDPGAVAGDKGAYSVITSATVNAISWLVLMLGNQANTAMTAGDWMFDIALGRPGSETPIINDLVVGCTGTTDDLSPSIFSLPATMPLSSAISIRASSSITDATDRLLDAVIVGVG